MKNLVIFAGLMLIITSAFSASNVRTKGALNRMPSSDGEYFCEQNPSQCKEILYPTVSFSGTKKYKIANSEEVVGVLTSVCIDAGFKSYAAGVIERIDKEIERKNLFFKHGHDGKKTGAFIPSSLTNEIISKVVCSPK